MNKHLRLAKELTSKLDLPMKIVSVEEDDGGLLTFRFSSENRVDLRNLVKKLQEETKGKVILHQVGEREETKFLTGVGLCGRKLCCASFLKNPPVLSSGEKTADDQIGVCGKSLCCLAFEEKGLIEEKISAQQTGAESTPQIQPQSAVPVKPSPQRILRVLPHKKQKHHRR
ncbi:MAG: regulatory iron-sulfur-containing complex subunit RicT [bacterium]|nr:regulatory iron-sulfur-containing complex subunit RicT [bacterium]